MVIRNFRRSNGYNLYCAGEVAVQSMDGGTLKTTVTAAITTKEWGLCRITTVYRQSHPCYMLLLSHLKRRSVGVGSPSRVPYQFWIPVCEKCTQTIN